MTIPSGLLRLTNQSRSGFPLLHEVACLPHEGLVTIDNGLRCDAVFVEAWRGHLLFQLANRGFRLGNSRFQRVDPLLPRLELARLLSRLGVGPLLLLVGRLRCCCAVTLT